MAVVFYYTIVIHGVCISYKYLQSQKGFSALKDVNKFLLYVKFQSNHCKSVAKL